MAWRAEDARRSVGRGREIGLVWLVGGGFGVYLKEQMDGTYNE